MPARGKVQNGKASVSKRQRNILTHPDAMVIGTAMTQGPRHRPGNTTEELSVACIKVKTTGEATHR